MPPDVPYTDSLLCCADTLWGLQTTLTQMASPADPKIIGRSHCSWLTHVIVMCISQYSRFIGLSPTTLQVQVVSESFGAMVQAAKGECFWETWLRFKEWDGYVHHRGKYKNNRVPWVCLVDNGPWGKHLLLHLWVGYNYKETQGDALDTPGELVQRIHSLALYCNITETMMVHDVVEHENQGVLIHVKWNEPGLLQSLLKISGKKFTAEATVL